MSGRRRATHVDAPVTTDLVREDDVDPHLYVLLGWGLSGLLVLAAVALIVWFAHLVAAGAMSGVTS